MWVSSVLAAAFLRVVILLPDIQNRKSDRDSHFFFSFPEFRDGRIQEYVRTPLPIISMPQ